MTEATGRQVHTVRAALSGLRQSGIKRDRTRCGQDTIYRIVASGAGDAVPTKTNSREQQTDKPTSSVNAADRSDATSFSTDKLSGEPFEVSQ